MLHLQQTRPIKVEVGGQPLELYIDFNTYAAFEERTGEHFLNWILSVQDGLTTIQHQVVESKQFVKENATEEELAAIRAEQARLLQALGVEYLKSLSAKKVLACLWAAMHTYNSAGEPTWPYSMGQLGALVADVSTIPQIMNAVLRAVVATSPKPKKKAEAEEEGDKADARPTLVSVTQKRGGDIPGPSDEDVLGLLTPLLED